MKCSRRPQRANLHRRQPGLTWQQLETRQMLAADLAGREYLPGEIVVQFTAQATLAQQAQARAAINGATREVIHTKVMQQAGVGRMERVTFGRGFDIARAIEVIERNPLVSFAEPNYIYRNAAVSDDTYYTNGNLWGMYSDDSPAAGPAGTTNQFGSHAEKAWASGYTGTSNIVVGVIDEGIQVTHPDLVDNIWVNPYETAGDGIDNDGNGYVDDIYGWDFVSNDNSVYDGTGDDHATHVAGTIGGKGGNGTGVAGVNWNVKMISAKFLGANGGTTTNAVRAVDYLTDLKVRHGINLVASNNSWGGGGYSSALHAAINRHAKQEILFIAAAGNSSVNNDAGAYYPSNYNTTQNATGETAATYDAVVSVASITSTGAMSSFSSYGATTVDIGAPGSSIVSTVPSNTYASYSGTSMATPHVAGAVALYASAQSGPVSANVIKQAILDSATPTASLAGKTLTGGRLNIANALIVSPFIGVNVSSPAPSASTTEAGGVVTFTVSLASQPTAEVTIPVVSSDTTEGAVNLALLTFTPANWNSPQTVSVTGVNDDVDDGNIAYSILLNAASSAELAYDGFNPGDVALVNQDNDTAGITRGVLSGTTTSEAGGFVTFTLRLNSEPTAPVSIGLSSSDTTEGSVSPVMVTFDSTNWNVEQTVTVSGVDDAIFDRTVAYNVIIQAATSSDLTYRGIDVQDVQLTNLDNEPVPSSKFYVVDDNTANRTFEYAADGTAIENYAVSGANAAPRGAAMTAVGDKVWVVDNNRNVYVYDTSGGLLGSWTAGTLATNASVQGIATDGTHIWIVDAKSDRVFYYANAASRVSGSQTATSFALGTGNTSPADLVFGSDGTNSYLWVVNSSTTDRVYRYSLGTTGGIALLNSWALNTANSTPTGITVDPSNGSFDIWVVDSGTDRVYRYADARNLAAPTLTSFFALTTGNTNPQGIADPPPAGSEGEVLVPSSTVNPLAFAVSEINRFVGPRAPQSSNRVAPVAPGAAAGELQRLVALDEFSAERLDWDSLGAEENDEAESTDSVFVGPIADLDSAFAMWN